MAFSQHQRYFVIVAYFLSVCTTNAINCSTFRDCEQLREVELCEGLQKIDNCAFTNCKSLELISLSSTVKVICADAFRGCGHLRDIELREGLEEIKTFAFAESSLRVVRVPSTVKTIGKYAFRDCVQLREVDLCIVGLN